MVFSGICNWKKFYFVSQYLSLYSGIVPDSAKESLTTSVVADFSEEEKWQE